MASREAEGLYQAIGEMLADKRAYNNKDVTVEKHGTKIILPSDPREMSEDEAIVALMRIKEQANMDVSIYEEINCFPLEGAYALMCVLKDIYGWANATPTPGFFGPKPPTMVNLEIAHNEFTQVIWGAFTVPNVQGQIQTSQTVTEGLPNFVISGTVKKKHQDEIKEIARRVRDFVGKNSLYKGKAIKIVTKEMGKGDYQMNMESAPKFVDLRRVNEAELVFSDEVMYQIETNLFTPIERTKLCREHRVPLKRGILLEGPYGTGKTLTAFVSAKKAVENGWTFVYLDRVSAIRDAMIFARRYAPAVIFAEDIERIVSNGRSVQVDDVLNNIDGIDSKNQEMITIFTTNHVDKIEKAMLRPGRLDAVISIVAPDKKAAEKLVRVYARDLIDANEDLTEAGKVLEGQIPATIREVVERSKLYAIGRLKDGEKLRLTGEDIRRAALGMKTHLEILNPKGAVPKTTGEVLGETFSEIIKGAVGSAESVQVTHNRVREMHERMN